VVRAEHWRCAITARLTGSDRDLVDRAFRVAAVKGDEAVAEHTGTGDFPHAYIALLDEAQALLDALGRLAERLAAEDQPAEDTRRLTAIRDLLAHFDWEYHDRQLALEAIERIAEGGS